MEDNRIPDDITEVPSSHLSVKEIPTTFTTEAVATPNVSHQLAILPTAGFLCKLQNLRPLPDLLNQHQ